MPPPVPVRPKLDPMVASADIHGRLVRRGTALEYTTLAWNVIGVIVVGVLALRSSSVALFGFALDSLIEIGASTVVIWELSGAGEGRRRRALGLIGAAFIALAAYLLIQSGIALATQHHAVPSAGGMIWTGLTALVMFALAFGKTRTGRALANPVLLVEGRVTAIDGILAVAVLLGIALDGAFGWWWADPIAGLVIVFYAAREAQAIFRGHE